MGYPLKLTTLYIAPLALRRLQGAVVSKAPNISQIKESESHMRPPKAASRMVWSGKCRKASDADQARISWIDAVLKDRNL